MLPKTWQSILRLSRRNLKSIIAKCSSRDNLRKRNTTLSATVRANTIRLLITSKVPLIILKVTTNKDTTTKATTTKDTTTKATTTKATTTRDTTTKAILSATTKEGKYEDDEEQYFGEEILLKYYFYTKDEAALKIIKPKAKYSGLI